jgi:uncharacterized damage-inducible protein DinB
MITSLDAFLAAWDYESSSTQRLLDLLTDASLAQPIGGDDRTLGRIAWHLAQTIPEMMGLTGLTIGGVDPHAPVPATARAIADGYRAASASFVDALRSTWTDDSLAVTDDMYGERWTRAQTLTALLFHQTHHRGQMTVLMRQAGLPVVGVYGPAREEWAAMGAPPPPV